MSSVRQSRRLLWLAGFSFMAALASNAAEVAAEPVVLISIDGLRPADILQADKRGLKVPNLRALVADGAYASGVTGVLPTLTYPSHVTLLTGVSPGRHGIVSNLSFDPYNKNQQGWNWYASDIKVPTLWQAAHEGGLKTVNVHWPVSVDAPGIDLNLPQIWRTGHPDDRKLMRALATHGLVDRLQDKLGVYADGIDESLSADQNRSRFGDYLIRTEKPGFTTLYFTSLDHIQHQFGPDTPEAHQTLEGIDAIIGKMVDAARAANPDTLIVVVSDHGFAPTTTAVNLYGAFIKAGLIDVTDQGEVSGWKAEPWFAGGSAAIVLADPKDEVTRAKVEGLLRYLQSDASTGIQSVIGKPQIVAAGGAPEADYWINFKIGYMMGADPKAPLVSPSTYRGMHGYFPDAPEMKSTLIIDGPHLQKRGDLGEVDMRDIAPTIAKHLGVKLDQAQGHPVD
jgi:predicted AlkP superfamily pyrophosphatase or phosphodiesterase